MALEGICIAPDSTTLDPTPTWLRLDGDVDTRVTRVASYGIDRGRQFELDQTDGGRATVSINDVDGALDPTNTGGDLYGLLEPLKQAGIARWNPVAEEWQTRFRGFVETWAYEFDPSQRVNVLTLSLVDIFEILQQIEMRPGTFGDLNPDIGETQNEVYFDPSIDVQTRLAQIRDNANLPPEWFVFFTGNVSLWEATYGNGESALAAMQDAADAEFPGVSNFYPDRFGRAVFHGRLAKFDPAGVWSAISGTDAGRNAVWALKHFHVGDGEFVAGAPGSRVQLRTFGFERGASKVFNSASATHEGIRDKDIPGQLFEDAASISNLGYRSWSKSNLLTQEGLLDPAAYTTKERLQGVAARAETLLFATYIVENYKWPRDRISTIGFRPLHDLDPRAAPIWELLCECDIADTVEVTVDSPGGGGFVAEPYFIEGVHEEVSGRAWGSGGFVIDDVTLTLDLSPQAYFEVNPFPTS